MLHLVNIVQTFLLHSALIYCTVCNRLTFPSQTNYFSGYPAPVMAPPPPTNPPNVRKCHFLCPKLATFGKSVQHAQPAMVAPIPTWSNFSHNICLPVLIFQHFEFLQGNYELFHSEDSCYEWRDKI